MPDKKPEMECRHCKRKPGQFHTMRCPQTRGGQKTMVEERQCYELTMAEGREIATELVRIKARLGNLGLFRTMHKLDLATKEIGYELAEHPVFQR
jgi:hypothetical protein